MIVGITGGIGSGKSIVSRCLRVMGYLVFEADKVAAELLNKDPQVAVQVVELLGEESYHPDGTANRSFIASQVFQNQQHLDALNSILHPAVDRAFKTWIQENREHRLLFKEAAILFESGAHTSVDQVLAVVAPEEIRIKRVQQRDGRSRDEVVKIMRNQMNQDDLIHRSDFVIHNDDQNLVLPALISVLNRLGEKP
jgi:dephospho-CoA kinase